MKQSAGIFRAVMLLALAPSIGAEGFSPDRARKAVEGVIGGAGALSPNPGASILLPDIPAPLPPGAKPAWEGRLEAWLKELGDDDVQVREKATGEMIGEQDPAFEERLKSILPKQSDPEIKARLGMVIEELSRNRGIRELKAKLSRRLLNSAPRIAEKAYSTEEKDLQEVLSRMTWPEDANGELHPEEMAATKEDVEILYPIAMGGLERIRPDITELSKETKHRIYLSLNSETQAVKIGMKGHVGYIEGLLKDPDPFYRGNAVTFLSVLRPDAETISEAATMLRDPDWYPRNFAVDSLDRMGAKEKEPEVLGLLGDPNAFVRQSCVYFLKRQTNPGDQKALEGVVLRLDDDAEQVAFAAMLTLFDWGKLDATLLASQPKTAIRAIGMLVRGFYPSERRKTLEALAKHPDPGVAQAASQELKASQEGSNK